MVLLDTDVAVDLLRGYPPARAWLESLGDTEILLPGFVLMELIQGCRDKTEQEKVAALQDDFFVVWPSPRICEEALSVFSCYHLSHGIGILDALIGQTAVNLGLPLHTFNQKHYASIPDLETTQPYQKTSPSS